MKHTVKKAAAFLVFLTLAVAIFSLARMNTEFVTLSYEGTRVTADAVAVAMPTALADSMAREITPSGIELSFDVRGEATVTVSGGCLYTVSADGADIVSLGSETAITEDSVLWWTVDGDEGEFLLTVTADGKQSVFVLELNENTPDGVIYKK